MERTDYEAQAQEFLDRFGFTIRAAFKGDRCPPWEQSGCVHGDRYRITIRRTELAAQNMEPKSISFDFWNSQSDMLAGKRPTAYDVLACISSEGSGPTDPDEVAEEFADLKPSQAIAIARFARRLQDFLTPDEADALAEIN